MDYHEFQKTAEKITSTSSSSGLKSATMPTMSGTAKEKEETSSEMKSEEDGSWVFDQIDISGAKQFAETSTSRLKLCSLNIKTPSAKQILI